MILQELFPLFSFQEALRVKTLATDKSVVLHKKP